MAAIATATATATAAVLLTTAVAVLISPAISLTCKSASFSPTTKFTNCTDLPSLNASLHWTFDPASNPKPTISIAFTAQPEAPDGWIAWGLNPTGSGMLGAQSLIASKDAGGGGSVVVKTYNISSYDAVAESEIAYEVLDKRAEFSSGAMWIFAKLALPERRAEVNQVWQLGAEVRNGVPMKHELSAENLMSKSKLWLDGTAATEKDDVPTAAGSEGSGSWRVWRSGVGLYGVLLVPVPAALLLFCF